MKIKITESQLKNLKKVINEANTAIDDLNNIIDVSDFTFDEDYTRVTFDKVMLVGEIEDGLSVHVEIDKVFYYYRQSPSDVTGFAETWALKDHNTGEDLALGRAISLHIVEIMNRKYTKYIGVEISEWDIVYGQHFN